jgi:hypothetical protein
MIGKYNKRGHGCWEESTVFPPFYEDKLLPLPDVNGVNMSLHFDNDPASEPWGDQNFYWPTDAYKNVC